MDGHQMDGHQVDVAAPAVGQGDRRLDRYRVEHRPGDGTAADWGLIISLTHHTALAPFVAHLALAGHATGQVVLVDEATGTVVARRALAGPSRRGWRGPAAPRRRRDLPGRQPSTFAAD